MKVLLEDVKLHPNQRYNKNLILITIRLKSGRSITLYSTLHRDGDMMDFIGKEVDVLLEGLRDPFVEHIIMPNNITPFKIEIKDDPENSEYKVETRDLIAEGTFIPKYFPDSKWNRKKLRGYGCPAFDTEDGIILLSNPDWNLIPKVPYKNFPKKFKMFLSLQLIDWLLEGHERRFNVSKPFYENKDKTFRIFLNKVNRVSPTVLSGYIEIFLGDFCIVSETYPIIHWDAFVKGITGDLIPKSDFDDYLIVRGCGCLGCCEGLFWDLKHEGEDIVISTIR